MIVDDDARFLGVLRRELEALEVEVVGDFVCGAEALAAVLALGPDLVLVDLMMPGMSGFELIDQLHRLPSRPRILAVSLHDDPSHRAACLARGADGFVPKTDLLSDLGPSLGVLP